MAQSEVSFDATGPTFVAFETTGSSLPAYGVGVYGIENGVRGVAGTKIINELAANGGSSGVTRDLVQTGVGVQGVGDSAGVRGDSEDTGVRGKGGVGVFGEGGFGVAGRGKYVGVLAAGDIAVRAEGDSIGTYSMAPTAVRAEGSVVGVLASGEGNGVGVQEPVTEQPGRGVHDGLFLAGRRFRGFPDQGRRVGTADLPGRGQRQGNRSGHPPEHGCRWRHGRVHPPPR